MKKAANNNIPENTEIAIKIRKTQGKTNRKRNS